jgi:hypothetical protein
MNVVNIILGFNTIFALLVLFGTALGVLGWMSLRLLRFVARLLRPLAEDSKPVPRAKPVDTKKPQRRKLAA